MCGIAGFAGEDREKIERMTECLKHRGPDGNAVLVTHGASLGHARLAIMDPRPLGDQPMWNEAKTVVMILNGEIYNFKDLRTRAGFRCTTNTDTEVLLCLYEKYGIRFVEKLRGMFAFGLYDTRTRTWHLARDTSGMKPLFVAYPNGKLHFASEMRTLMSALTTKPELNYTALSQYLRLHYIPGPQTLCKGIESLPPGTILSWQEGKEQRETFSAPTPSPIFHSKTEFSERFPAIMDEAVKYHLVSDRPVGIFLSGGMDSSIVLHHMSKHAAKPIKTFTVRFDATEQEGAKRFNADADLARLTAVHYDTDHHEVVLTATDYARLYADTARALDQPNADSVSVAQFLLAREAKKHVDVVLCGAGGDELFAGYPRYRIAKILHAARHIPVALRSLSGSLLRYPPDVLALEPGPELAERLLARPAEEVAEIVSGTWFEPEATTALFHERFAALSPSLWDRNISSPQRRGLSDDVLRQFMEFDRHLWLVDESLKLLDATTMASGLEGRIPFLDPTVIAASHATPANWHVTFRKTKALLKDTYRGILPEHLFSLPKAGFFPPLAKWLRREAAVLVDETFEHPRMRQLFEMEKVRGIFKQHKSHQKYALHTLQGLIQLRCWFETVYEA